ncbi:MaoC family dehydratase [Pseudohongiella nitratireducens]|uniref:MaoC family dehydratase n=1 Tax=Pseudohongiella nitratireducens TaxID=1768907 RepID=UPI0030EE92D6
MSDTISPETAKSLIGRETGVSPWLTVTQEQIDRFAKATGDDQFIHVDAERAAKETPFGGTIAHGYLTLSLLTRLGAEAANIRLDGTRMTINYGLDKVRFLTPVRAGARIRARFVLLKVDEKHPGQYLFKYQATVDIEGNDKPALIAETLSLAITGGSS